MTKHEQLAVLKKKMEADKGLPLRESANKLVFGSGNCDSPVLFIGEAPGYWEDQKGEPFVGNAGALLNQLLASIGLTREEVFITNVLHYRPPENRDPTPDEIASYQPYLDEIIAIIDPKVIVTLGRFSMAKFIPGVFISSIHGKVKEVNWHGKSIIVVPMYHPAAALRSSEVKFKLSTDFLVIKQVLENKTTQEVGKSTKSNKVEVKQMNLI